MSAKLILLFILSLSAGIGFIGVGIYFLSSSFAEKLKNASPTSDEKSQRKINFRARGSGYTAIATGALTLVWGITLFMIPQAASVLALIYMIFLIAAFSVLTFVFK